MSEIFVTETARHDLKKLDPPVRKRIIQKLEKYREAPKQFART
jgi:mRNA-degrading endonuclease RelE of RelBE toxin-antitoxin system